MTACSLEPMDITKFWVFSLEMLCQVFTAATLSCCLFVGLSAFSLVFSNWKACSIGLRSGDWLGHWRIFHFFAFKKVSSCFRSMFRVIIHLHCEAASYQFCSIWLNVSREYSHKDLRIYTSISSYIINKHQWACSIDSHTCPFYHTAPPCFTLDVCFGSSAVPFFRHTLPISLSLILLSCYQWFAPCCKPSVFTFMKVSLDCRFWQWCAELQSFLKFCWCYDGVFLHQGKDSAIMHFSCLPWSFRPFDVLELTSAFFFLKNVANRWSGHTQGLCYLSYRFMLFFSA